MTNNPDPYITKLAASLTSTSKTNSPGQTNNPYAIAIPHRAPGVSTIAGSKPLQLAPPPDSQDIHDALINFWNSINKPLIPPADPLDRMRDNARAFQMQELMESTPKEEIDRLLKEKQSGVYPKHLGPNPILAGTWAGVEDLARGFTSPIGLATLGIGGLPRIAQRIIALLFAGQMLKQTPDLAQELGAEFGKPPEQRDNQKIARLITTGAGSVGFAALAAKHGLEPNPGKTFAENQPPKDKLDQSLNTPPSPHAPENNAAAPQEPIIFLEKAGTTGKWSYPNAPEANAQIENLRQWAQTTGRVQYFEPPPDAERLGGNERDGYLDPNTNRVYKRTDPPGTFGFLGVGPNLERTATPYAYLQRIALMNQIFGSDIRVEGITPGDKPSIITSEPFHQADNPRSPHPSPDEIGQFMRSKGFEPMPNVPDGWSRGTDGIKAYDARPANFIQTKDGLVPIDLVLQQGPPTLPKK